MELPLVDRFDRGGQRGSRPRADRRDRRAAAAARRFAFRRGRTRGGARRGGVQGAARAVLRSGAFAGSADLGRLDLASRVGAGGAGRAAVDALLRTPHARRRRVRAVPGLGQQAAACRAGRGGPGGEDAGAVGRQARVGGRACAADDPRARRVLPQGRPGVRHQVGPAAAAVRRRAQVGVRRLPTGGGTSTPTPTRVRAARRSETARPETEPTAPSGWRTPTPGAFSRAPARISSSFIRECFRALYPEVDPRRVRKIVEAELGAPVAELFSDFAHDPLATATIAQVHVAHLHDASKTKVAVKVQNPDSEALMAMDMENMLRVSTTMDSLELHLPFDHTSILREYQKQVPLEFDFRREANMLRHIGGSLQGALPDVSCPKVVDGLCTKRVMTMTFVEGEALGDIIQRAINAEGLSSAAGSSAKAAAAMKTKGGVRVDGEAVIAKLIETFGVQIFALGKFHSDPHPGNLLVAPDGKTLSIIDFGQTKVMDDATRLGFARLILALGSDRRDEALAEVANLGLKLTNATPDFALTVCYILFDTRMDLEEAHLSPLDADIPEDMRVVNIRTIPEELFMLIRVIALIRGMLISLDCDVHARTIWRPYAIAALRAANHPVPRWALEHEVNGGASGSGRAGGGGGSGSVYQKMKTLALWMRDKGLPYDRKALMPLAGHGLMSVAEIAAAAEANEEEKLTKAFRKFTEDQKTRCLTLAAAEAATTSAKAEREAALEGESAKATKNLWKTFKRITGVTMSLKATAPHATS